MADSLSEQIAKLRASLSALEAQRPLLGDVIDPVIALTRQQLAALDAKERAQDLPADERRLVTILFSDVVGSTSLAENLDPEDWRQTIARVLESTANLIVQHQGQVAQYTGDGLLAFFGAQQSREVDPENAIRAALDMQAAVNDRAAQLQPPGPAIQLRISIHTGLVVVGELGAQAHREFTAIGDAVNLAARLQTVAPPGGIIISHETYRYVRGVFDVLMQPPVAVKGKSLPVQTYLVRRAKSRPFRSVVRGVAGVETRTIGRERESAQLQDAYFDAVEHRRVVWAQLMGEPGVGKSRLLEDTRERIDLRPETVLLLRARAFAEDARQPFALVRRMWFDRFQISEDALLSQAEAKWVQQFNAFLGKVDLEAAHALGLLIGLPFADSPYVGGMRNDPAQVKQRAFIVSRALLNAMRAQNPVELLLEDLHWADAASLDYLIEVVWHAEQNEPLNGIFVLGTARMEWQLPAALTSSVRDAMVADADASSENDHPSLVVIPLAPLPEAATRELAKELLQKVEHVPAEIVQMVAERSEGVPYFAEELVNYFLDRGIIDTRQAPWRLVSERLQESPLPATLQYLLMARLDTLTRAQRAALQRGAIFGRHFWSGGIEALGVPHSTPELEALQPRGLVEKQPDSSLEGESEWAFHHTLLRDVTYESVLKRERAALHEKAATWLEAQARRAGRLQEFVGLLGDHCEKAGALGAAAQWFLRAGEHAMGQGATQQARDFFDRALALLPPDERESRWRALAGREGALGVLGERDQQQADITALLSLADELQDESRRAEVWVRQALVAQRGGDNRGSLQAAEQALAAAEHAGNAHLRLHAIARKVFALTRLGQVQAAQQLAAELVAQARALGDDTSLSEGLGSAANVWSKAGDLARAAELGLEAAEAARRSGARFREANWLANLGLVYVQLGLYKQGRATLEQALVANQAIGARRSNAYNLQNLGFVSFRQGDGREARRLVEESKRELAALGDEYGRAMSVLYLALILERSGDWVAAEQCFQESAEVCARLEEHGVAQDALAGLARCGLGRGQLAPARERSSALWQYLREHGSGGMDFPIWAYLTCADVFDALGAPDESRDATEAGYRQLMAQADKISNPAWRASFLENVAEHRALVELWERTGTAQSP